MKHSDTIELMGGDTGQRSLPGAPSSYGQMAYVRHNNNETNPAMSTIKDHGTWARGLFNYIHMFKHHTPTFHCIDTLTIIESDENLC